MLCEGRKEGRKEARERERVGEGEGGSEMSSTSKSIRVISFSIIIWILACFYLSRYLLLGNKFVVP